MNPDLFQNLLDIIHIKQVCYPAFYHYSSLLLQGFFVIKDVFMGSNVLDNIMLSGDSEKLDVFREGR